VVGSATVGDRTVRSAEASTDATGAFALAFPPGASVFDIQVSPGSNPDVPETWFRGVTSNDPPPELVLGVDPPVVVSAVVYDDNQEPVQDAAILFEGQVGQGTFTATGSTNSLGAVTCEDEACKLIPGSYTVTVAPHEAQPYAITSAPMEVPNPDPPVVVTVRNKVRVSGFVSAHDGQPAVGAKVTLTSRSSPTRREFSAVTNSEGWYRVDVDPGEAAAPVVYEQAIETRPSSGLPWSYALLEIGASHRRADVALYEPSFAYGRVLDPVGIPLADTFIAFYSLELEIREGVPLLVGVVQTGETGEFALPLPTPDGP
jgi:hypothetical protein